MKTKLSKNWVASAAATIITLALANGPGLTVNAQDQPPPPPADGDNAMPDTAAALPPGVDANGPLAEVIRLAQSGVSETVIMSYVNNSTSPFNLTADQIIYLKDLGVPDDIVQAMIQRDQTLQQQAAVPPPPAPATTTVVETAPPPPAEVTVDYFYTSLAPYGSWVYIEGYGRCWRPGAAVYSAGWSPYCDHGHWIWTDCGWYWISDYSWGWAPFHYGRWFRDAHFGWCWYPDTVWGPSWVTWRYGDGYCGWAPLPPRCVYREGAGFFYNGVSVGVNFDFGLSVNLFTFVPTRDFCDAHPWHYRVAPREVTQIYNHTTIINNFNVDSRDHRFINHGIDPGRITEVTHREIHPVTIRDTNERLPRGQQMGRDGQTLMVNRPHFGGTPRTGRGEAPRGSGPAVGTPNQPPHVGNDNHNPQGPDHFQPAPARPGTPVTGTPNQPPRNGNEDRNSHSPTHFQPTPMPASGGQQAPPVATHGSPRPNPVTPPTQRPTPPVYHPAPVTPVQPSAPSYNSPDFRRYQSPRMQQSEQQSQRGSIGGNSYIAPQPPTRNYGAPVTPQAPPQARQPESPRAYTPPPVQTPPPQSQPERNYNTPRNEAPPANYSQPQSQGNQSRGGNASSSQGQSQGSQGQGNGRGRDQNGR